jgi:hypothetical protein
MTRFVVQLAIAIVALESASAFITPTSSSHATSTTTVINLVPEQGRQLVAFSQDYLSKRAKESAHRASNLTNPRRRHGSGSTTHSRSPHHHKSSSNTTPGIFGLVTRLLGQHDQGKGRGMMENHYDDEDSIMEEFN